MLFSLLFVNLSMSCVALDVNGGEVLLLFWLVVCFCSSLCEVGMSFVGSQGKRERRRR